MEKFRVVFCGTPETAVPSLRALAADPAYEISLVITQPDKPKGRGLKLQPSPVAVATEDLGLEVAKPADINRFAFSHFRIFAFLVVVAYGQLLKKHILDLPTIAPVNLHFSLLPRWRGASPVEHAILEDDRETGVTVIEMVEELDAGPILAQEKIALGGKETTPALKESLAKLGATLLVDTLQKTLARTPQPPEGVTICHRIQKEDGIVDLSRMPAEEIDRRVRALQPWPGVQATLNGQSVKLIATSLTPSPDSLLLPCAEGTTLFVTQIQAPGRKVVTGKEWERGR